MIRARSSSRRFSKYLRSSSFKRSSPFGPGFAGAGGRAGAVGGLGGITTREVVGAGFVLAMDSGGSTPRGRTSAGGFGADLPLAGAVRAAPGRMAFGVAGTSFGTRFDSASALAAAAARASASAFAAAAPLLSAGGALGAGFAGGRAFDLSTGFTTVLAASFAGGFAPGFLGAGLPFPGDLSTRESRGFEAGFAASFLRTMAIANTSVFTSRADAGARVVPGVSVHLVEPAYDLGHEL